MKIPTEALIMKIRLLIPYTKKLLKGRNLQTGLVCILPLCSEIFFRAAETTIYSILLYLGEMPPLSLFSGSSPVQLSAALVLTLMRWTVTAPLCCTSAFRLSEICSESHRCTPFSRVLLNRTFFRRSLGALMWTKLIGLIALAPAAFFGVSAYSMLHGTLSADEMFMAVNAIVLTAVSLLLWLSLKLSFSAVPFLIVRYPQKSALRNVLYSVKFMSGRKNILLRLAAAYILPAVSIVGFPFALTRAMTAFSLSIDIFTREDEYREGIKAYGRNRKARDITGLPDKTGRSLNASPEKA